MFQLWYIFGAFASQIRLRWLKLVLILVQSRIFEDRSHFFWAVVFILLAQFSFAPFQPWM